jgi:hypothetical protein
MKYDPIGSTFQEGDVTLQVTEIKKTANVQRLLVCKQKELQSCLLFSPARLHVRQQKRQETGYIQVSDHELNEL